MIRGTILDTSEDLMDPTRNIRPLNSFKTPAIGGKNGLGLDHALHSDNANNESENGDDNVDDEESEGTGILDDEDQVLDDDQTTDDPTRASDSSPPPIDGAVQVTPTGATDEIPEDEDLGEEEERGQGETQSSPSSSTTPTTPSQSSASTPTATPTGLRFSLADFDSNGVLDTSASYLLFVPSGKTIEDQFFSLITSLWIAKHSNRTLIIPPPMMAPPSLYDLYPYFAGPKGRKRQRWSTLFDLRSIVNSQPVVLIDQTRPVLQSPFTDDMAREEETPTTNEQAIPFVPETSDYDMDEQSTTPVGSTIPFKIKCYGPPTAGSWKSLDFAGRHFLNRYNLVADFEVLDDAYWNLKPEYIQRYWRATPPFGTSDATDKIMTHHQQLACISGAELIGKDDPAMEEAIWEEMGLPINFARGIKDQAMQNIQQTVRGLEGQDRRNGYIGVHIDKLPPREFCHHDMSSFGTNLAAASALDDSRVHAENGDRQKGSAPAGSGADEHRSPAPQQHSNPEALAAASSSSTSSSSPTPSECLWTVDLIAKRIAMLQKSEGAVSRPVILTTTETDPEILSKIDQQGWLRLTVEEFNQGLFDEGVDLGGYGHEVIRAFVMANSAIFVGSRGSALSLHTAFKMKYQGRSRQVPPRWELY
ncbi:hypothetical protein BGZ94_009099 [Podila epigama]|nr:hypothetical protein BGZ94_009099 [Podila epigama]